MNTSRHSDQQQQQPFFASNVSTKSSNRWFPIPCNKCRQPIDATAFVCSCDCLFCEDCTFNHFRSNPNCPRCGRILGENDFTEVAVSDPDSKISNDPNKVFQSLLTKTPSNNVPNGMTSWNDVCAALLREHQVQERNTRFFVTQFVQEAEKNIEEGQNAVVQVRAYQEKLAKYKSDIIELQRQQEENKERLRQREKQLAEKDNQIQQLKRILANSNNNGIRNSNGGGRSMPSSSSSAVRVTAPSRSSSSSSTSSLLSINHHHPPHHHNHRGFQTYVRKKEEREMAEERDLMNLTRNKKIIFGHRQR